MSYISEKDRYYIENKYHRTDEAFDPFDRLNYHGYEYDASTGLDDAQMHAALEELFEQNRGTDHALAKARGFAFILDHARIDVSQNDWFFGLYNWARPLTKTFLSKWYTELFDTMPDVRELMHDYNASGTAELWLDTEHVVPYWVDILKLGFRGYRHLAEFAPSSVKGIFRVLTSLVSWVVSFIPRRPERSETAQPSDQALAQQ